MQIHLRLYFIAAALLSFILVVSQNKEPSHEELVSEHQQAKKIYDVATAAGNSKNYDEEKERSLNQQALDRFLAIFKKIPSTKAYDSLRFQTSFIIGELHHYFENHPPALEYYAKSIEIHRNSALPDSFLLRPYIYSGLIYYQQNRINLAAEYFSLADSVQQKYPSPLKESERLYNTLGVIHYETGNYRLARFYFHKALELLPKTNPYYLQLMTNYKINIAHIHFTLEEYEEANNIYHELLQYNTNHNEIYLNLGIINLNLGAPRKALMYFRMADTVNNNRLPRLYNHFAKAHLNLRQLDSAEHFLNRALAVNENGKNDPAGYGLSLKTKAELLLQKNDPLNALHFFSRAVPCFYPAYTQTSIKENPLRFTGVFSFASLFSTLAGKAEAAHALYIQTKDISWAVEELEIYQSAFKLVGYVEKTYNSDEARIFINRYKYEVHSKPIDIAYALFRKTGERKYLEDLYQIDQQNKASVLALNQATIRMNSIRDSALVRQEREIKADITRSILKASQTKDSAQQSAYAKIITDQEILLDRVQNRMNEKTPASLIPSVGTLQKDLLDASTAILSFHLSPEKLTIFTIRDKMADAIQVNLDQSFHDNIQAHIAAVRDPASAIDIKRAKALYRLLFREIPLEGIKRLIIIPDDELNFLPFETLLDDNDNYLFETYSVQYQYSTAVLKKENKKISQQQTIAFAPFATSAFKKDSINFSRLPFSMEEIEGLDGEKMVGKTATRNAFLENVGKFNIVHLATHAVAGEGAGASFIVFASGRQDSADFLFAEEIYNLELKNTSLAILSACETGAGKLVKGEGVMSLSRAFTYAGCPNIITSFWKADDRSTAYLSKRIHFYLDKEYTIDRAVQQARLDFLEDKSIHPSMRHPYYWGHLIFIGNYKKEGNRWWPWITAAILAGSILLIAGKRFLKINKKNPATHKD